MTRVMDLEREYPGIVPDLEPEGSVGRHALLALTEYWTIAIFGTWHVIAQGYVRDHYRPAAHLSPRGAASRQLELESTLEAALKAWEDGA